MKLGSTWIKGLNIKPLNLIEERLGNTLEQIGTEDNFLKRTQMAQVLIPTINKWDLIEVQSFYKTKNTVNRTFNRSLQTGKGFSRTLQSTNIQDLQRTQEIRY